MRDRHVLVGPLRLSRQAQHGVTVLEQALRGRYMTFSLSGWFGSKGSAPAERSTGRATHSPIIGT